MSTPIPLKITDIGLASALSLEASGIKIELDHIKYSSDNFESVVMDSRIDLNNIIAESSIAVGGVSEDGKTLRFFSVINIPNEIEINSLGVYTKEGVLFALASVPTGNLFKVYGGISFIASFGLALAPSILSLVTIVTDQNAALALTLIHNHEMASNPHPQYSVSLGGVEQQIQDISAWANQVDNRLLALEDRDTQLSNDMVGIINNIINIQNNTYPKIILSGVLGHNGSNSWYYINRPNDTVNFLDIKYTVILFHEAKILQEYVFNREFERFAVFINVLDSKSGKFNTRRINYIVVQSYA